MKTIDELSRDTFYDMENYSQLVIDFVQEVEDLVDLDNDDVSILSLLYDIDNVLEVIDKNRFHDLEALECLSDILRNKIKSD